MGSSCLKATIEHANIIDDGHHVMLSLGRWPVIHRSSRSVVGLVDIVDFLLSLVLS